MKKRLPNVLSILAWPLGCLVLAVIMWSLLLSRLGERETEIGKAALREASAQSKSYAEQLARAVSQIDQITLHLKYYWTDTKGRLSVEDQQRQGLYPASALLYVTISDRDGNLKTSSLPLKNVANISGRDYFIAHKNHPHGGLLISNPAMGIRSQKTLMRFSRRLDSADGSFDGVVMVAVEPAFLAPAQDDSTIGRNDFMSLFKQDGLPLLVRTMDVTQTQQTIFRSLPVLTGTGGTAVASGASFSDGKERIVSWHAVRDYPLFAVVGMSTRDIYASFRERAADYKFIATACSVFLTICALAGMLFSTRLAIRRHETEKAREAYGIATEGGNDGFYMWLALRNKDGEVVDFQVLDCNERGAAIFGADKANFIGRHMSRFYSQEYFARLMQTFRTAMENGEYKDEYRTPPESPLGALWLHRRMVRTRFGLAITVRDVSETRAHEAILLEQLDTDELTGLHNRHWVIPYLNKMLHEAAGEGRSFAVLFLDLDDFKNVNDTLGHSSGDLLLQAVTQRLRELVAAPHETVRFGGDSFTVIQQTSSSDDAAQLAERILQAFSKPLMLADQNILQVSLSIGISMFPRDGESVDALLKHADIAMHAAKSDGKKRFRFYQPQLSERLQVKIENETALRLAIERDEFILHFQPRVNTMSGEFCSMEALVRWQHPVRGMVSPLEFIPVAEETGLILKLGEQIIRKACAQLAQWKTAGLPALPMSVNVSSRQLNQGNLNTIIATALRDYGIDPAQMEIELTESCMMADTLEIAEELAFFQELGIKLLVDDFGTGYSSLSQLQRLDMDVLKVDKAFTAELGVRAEGEVFFNAIVSMAHALRMTVVAEGVETEAQLHLLQALCCDEVQGYYISPPVPATDIPHLMRRRYLFPASPVTLA
ncbi:EAL domain-containing protein [Herbaspirillum sp. RV1423]|uniref:bifunctional diguanylate cyclase/phosphodiesterase n=1 Tax=Herbaspirillum sp. RV1423 TaxID=1443993 RepID=UPI000551C405|nr:EAL domain-containing protein [Herbaspirillum sp. RV1423]